MSMASGHSPFRAFVERVYRNDPELIWDAYRREAEAQFSGARILWDRLQRDLGRLGRGYAHKAPSSNYFPSGTPWRGRAKVYVEVKEDKSGVLFPAVTVQAGGKHAHVKGYWSALEALWDEFRACGFRDPLSDEQRRKREAAQEAKRRQREAQIAAAEAKAKLEQARAEVLRDYFLELFDRSPRDDGHSEYAPGIGNYLAKKGVSRIVECFDIRRLTGGSVGEYNDRLRARGLAPLAQWEGRKLAWQFKPCAAFVLCDIAGRRIGLQRFFGPKSDDKRQTPAVIAGEFNGAFAVIGDTTTALRVALVEGFATGASLYLAAQETGLSFAVVVAMWSNNVVHVLNDFHKLRPATFSQMELFTDDDRWTAARGRGNTGILNGLAISKDYGCRVYAPDFDGLSLERLQRWAKKRRPELANCADAETLLAAAQPTDFNDLHELGTLQAVLEQLDKKHARQITASKTLYEYHLQRLPHVGLHQAESETYTAISTMMELVPIRFCDQDVLDKVTAAQPKGLPASEDALRKTIQGVSKRKMREANALRGFTEASKSLPNVHYQKLEGVIGAYGKRELPDWLPAYMSERPGFHIVRSGKGSRKSEIAIAGMLPYAHYTATLSHRIGLTEGLAGTLTRIRRRLAEHKAAELRPLLAPAEKALKEAEKQLRQALPDKYRSIAHVLAVRQACNRRRAARKALKALREQLEAEQHTAKTFEVASYSDVEYDQLMSLRDLVLCVNSIINEKFTDHLNRVDWLNIDEAVQVMNHIAKGPVERRETVLSTTEDLMEQATGVVLCDADANDMLVKWCRRVDPDKPIYLYELEVDGSDFVVEHGDIHQVTEMAARDMANGLKVSIATDSKTKVEAVAWRANELRAEMGLPPLPPQHTLIVHLDSREQQEHVRRALADPDAEFPKYGALIYSPTMGTGVSFTVDHFERHYALFHGVISPTDCMQMLHRDRTAKHFIVGLGHMSREGVDKEEQIALGIMSCRAEADPDASLSVELTENRIIATMNASPFDLVNIAVTAYDRRMRKHGANTFLLGLIADGYQVEPLGRDDLIEDGKEAMKAACAHIRDERHNRILEQITPDEDHYFRLQMQELRTREEQAMIVRWEIENLLASEVTAETIAFYEKGGLRRMAAFEDLKHDREAYQAFDNAQARRGVSASLRSMRVVSSNLRQKIFAILGIDPQTLQGRTMEPQCREVINWLLDDKHPERMHQFNHLKLGKTLLNRKAAIGQPVVFVNAILERLGLKFSRPIKISAGPLRGRHAREIEQDAAALMQGMFERRQARGISSITVHTLEDAYSASNKGQSAFRPNSRDMATMEQDVALETEFLGEETCLALGDDRAPIEPWAESVETPHVYITRDSGSPHSEVLDTAEVTDLVAPPGSITPAGAPADQPAFEAWLDEITPRMRGGYAPPGAICFGGAFAQGGGVLDEPAPLDEED